VLLLGRRHAGEHVGHQPAVRAFSRGLEAAGGIIAGQVDVGRMGAVGHLQRAAGAVFVGGEVDQS